MRTLKWTMLTLAAAVTPLLASGAFQPAAAGASPLIVQTASTGGCLTGIQIEGTSLCYVVR